jgi:hypothetical protein
LLLKCLIDINERARLAKFLDGIDGLILLPSAPVVLRDESGILFPIKPDTELPGWRETSNIIYVLGKYDITGSFILVNATASPPSYSVVLPEYSHRDIVFSGSVIDRDEMKTMHLLENVYDINQLSQWNQGFLTPNKGLGSSSPAVLKSWNIRVDYSEQVEQAFIESRFIKTPEELILLRYSSQVASYTHRIVSEAIQSFPVVTGIPFSSF